MTPCLQVIVESESTEAERAAVTNVFDVVGIPADVQGAYIRESAGDVLPWLIQIETTVKDLFGLVAAGAAGAVGADGWTGVKDLVRHLYEARKGKDGGVTLRDPETRTEIPLPPDLPDEAYQRLAEIENPRAQQSGHLRWNSGRREWIDPLACTAAVTRAARSRQRKAAFARSARRPWNDGNSAPLMPRPLISETTGHGPDGRPVAVTTDRSSDRHPRNSEAATLPLLWPYPASPLAVPPADQERGN